ncbi:hypothetical protein VTN31DRAFT_7354 [Thermomyces dupontii]|uniref:uncharacterized protein n=1 Tax=Talaromyces thermophilus TaxID=28565 RepID=UPI003741FBEF
MVKRKNEHTSDNGHDWRDIDVIGELKGSNHGVKGPLVQLAVYAREVFAWQPTRRYLHAFTICGSWMTTWVFDRSGCYSPDSFNIRQQPERFIRVIAGYVMMNEEELGRDTFIQRDGDRYFIQFEKNLRFQLKPKPLLCHRAIVSRGTSCFFSRMADSEDWDYVTKFSWTSDRWESEVRLLQRANERGVKGIVRLVGHCDITSISELRSEMTFKEPYTFRDTPNVSPSQSVHPPCPAVSSENPSWNSAVNSSGRLGKRKATSEYPKSKRSRFESGSVSAPKEVTFQVREAQGTTSSRSAPHEGPYDNRILRCLVIFPAGRPIYKYESPLELVAALRDAIKAHRSLYLDGKILHRDISESNIIITDREKTGFAGMLIDMDLAKELDQGRSDVPRPIGTTQFMAIQVLLNEDHTYRHDLESFFYVLLWQCARRGWEFVGNPEGQPTYSHLRNWYTGTFKQIAVMKIGLVASPTMFEILTKEFPPELENLKLLCRKLRRILFSSGSDGPFDGTPEDPEVLYRPMIEAFDEAILELSDELSEVSEFSEGG